MRPTKIFLYKHANVDKLKEKLKCLAEIFQQELDKSTDNPTILNVEDAWLYFKRTILTATERNAPQNISLGDGMFPGSPHHKDD